MASEGYVPVDLRAVANAEADLLGADHPLPVGRQRFRGLPFDLGLIHLGGTAGSGPEAAIRIDVGAPARWLVFAHRLVESEVYGGAPIGGSVADYVVRYADGATATIPIRERFEIAIPDDRWTQIPFRALWDIEYRLPPRLSGTWDEAGIRQTESDFPGTAVNYALHAWQNARPDTSIDGLEIVPGDRRFVLAGVTRGTLDEHPLRVGAPRDVIVTLRDEDAPAIDGIRAMARVVDATAAAELRVEVDRGLANYPFAISTEDDRAFLDEGRPGWGELTNDRSTPAYAKVAATPSATLTVSLGDRELGSVRWGELEAAGELRPSDAVTIEVVDEGRNWVRTRIVDDATGEPIACRVHFRSPRGVPYQPHGHHNHVNSNNGSWHTDVGGDVRLGQMSYAYVDGTCEGWLPRGDVLVDVAQGFEYEPLRTRVSVEPGQQSLELRLKRTANMNARGWYSGDTHVHFLSPQGGITEARAEGVNVVNVLQAQWGSLFTNTEDFAGAPHVSRDGRTIVWVSQENRQHVLGHMSLLGLRRPVMPWSSDGLGEAEMAGTLETTMSDWADRAHQQGGTVVIPHFPSPNGETATLVATRRVDAIEMIRHGPYEHATWYRYLNAGYRLPLVGGTDKMSSDTPVGIYRTYVRIPGNEPFNHDTWCRNLRLGRTFHSGGPLLRFTVDGQEIGDTVALPAGGTVAVEASVESIFPVSTLELVMNGEVIAAAEAPAGGGSRQLTLKESVRVDGHSWLAVRAAGGPGYWNPVHHFDSWRRVIFAHTSPIYVAVGGPWTRVDREVSAAMLQLIDGALGYMLDLSPQADPSRITHHHGESDHAAFLSRPYLEAREAIRQHLDD